MGVDWYTCGICGDTFPDCGVYGTCANCEEYLCANCHEKQGDKYGIVEEGSEQADFFGDEAILKCDQCSGLIIRDSDIAEHLLSKCGITRGEAVDEIKKLRGITP